VTRRNAGRMKMKRRFLDFSEMTRYYIDFQEGAKRADGMDDRREILLPSGDGGGAAAPPDEGDV